MAELEPCTTSKISLSNSRAIPEAVICYIFTAEDRIQSYNKAGGICGENVTLERAFFAPKTSIFPCQ
jgi:hypothetical protein